MKKMIYLFLLPLLAVIVSCGNKDNNKNAGSLLAMQDSTDAQGLQRMQSSKAEVNIKFKGSEYRSFISRMPDETLSHVISPSGDTFVDNKITLCLTRGNELVFNKTFTKHDFASVVGKDFLSKSILEGMVFNKTTPAGIVYAASVCYPQTDLYVPFSITITAGGQMTILKEEFLEEVYDVDSI